MKNGMQKRFGKTVSTVRKSHSRMLAACRRGNSVQLDSSRCGAGSIPWVVHRTGSTRAERSGRPGAPVGVLW